MKKIQIITLAVLCGLLWSCIQEEKPNSEADILSCILPTEILKADPIIQNNAVIIMVNKGTDLTAIAPEFTLTPGAVIEPANGTKRDFTYPQEYTVISEDGEWQKKYKVSFIDSDLSTIYHFEDTIKKEKTKYYTFVEKLNNKVIMEWASGNSGFSLTGKGTAEDAFPTLQSDKGVRGKCLQLITRSTGAFGAMAGMPIAAGNLFIGNFDVNNALTSPLKATKFGLPFYNVPTYLTGYYKYKAGANYTEGGKPAPDKKDMCNIYAVFYETDDQLKTLDGTNQLDHPNIISVAQIDSPLESDEWLKFNIEFIKKTNKTIDAQKLKEGKYNIAIIFSSSINGDKFNGAIGSTLFIDEVELLHKTL